MGLLHGMIRLMKFSKTQDKFSYSVLCRFSQIASKKRNANTFNLYSERPENLKNLTGSMLVYDDFISESEEQTLFKEVEPYLKRLRYEFNHWDNAIEGFRETERSKWNDQNSKCLSRLKDFSFSESCEKLSYTHVLDLAEDGVIKPHVDSVRFCGDTIAGLSLLSDSVMRLVNEKDSSQMIDVLLKRRSLYIIRGIARYDYTHQILPKDESIFNGKLVKKTRRISIICRNEPANNT